MGQELTYLIHKPGWWLSLSLFVFRIFADYSDTSFSFDDFALFANRFYWWSNLHVKPSFQKRPFYII